MSATAQVPQPTQELETQRSKASRSQEEAQPGGEETPTREENASEPHQQQKHRGRSGSWAQIVGQQRETIPQQLPPLEAEFAQETKEEYGEEEALEEDQREDEEEEFIVEPGAPLQRAQEQAGFKFGGKASRGAESHSEEVDQSREAATKNLSTDSGKEQAERGTETASPSRSATGRMEQEEKERRIADQNEAQQHFVLARNLSSQLRTEKPDLVKQGIPEHFATSETIDQRSRKILKPQSGTPFYLISRYCWLTS